MGEITALEPQKKTLRLRSGQGPKRVNLFVDGKFVLGLDLETAVKEKLEIGKEITPQDLKYLTEVSGRQKILDRVFRFLSFRPRSKKEVRDYLLKKKIDPQEAEDITQELVKKNYLNDEEFARWWVEQRAILQPKGWRALKMELRQKGVEEEIIEGIMNYESGTKEKELAQKVVEKKSRSMGKLPPQVLKEKLLAALLRRGFDWEVAKGVIDETLKKK